MFLRSKKRREWFTEKKRKKGLTHVRSHGAIIGTIAVFDPINVEDDESCVLTAQKTFYGNGGSDHSKEFIQDGLRGSIAIEIIG